MRKWFTTNYHYIVPEFEDSTEIQIAGDKPFEEVAQAQALGVAAKPVLVGPLTLLKLSRFTGARRAESFATSLAARYREILERFAALAVEWVQLDEPILATDLSADDTALLTRLYDQLLGARRRPRVLLQTYFGDVRDCYQALTDLSVDGIGLDFVEGTESHQLIAKHGFPDDKTLFAGLVNGKNIWRNRYEDTLERLDRLREAADKVVLSTSCSLLHVPYTVTAETAIPAHQAAALAFAQEKLAELRELGRLAGTESYRDDPAYQANQRLHRARLQARDEVIVGRTAALTDSDYSRRPARAERAQIQRQALNLPLLPTTTIGSFPQTREVKLNRAKARRGEITEAEYRRNLQAMTARWITSQEELGLDVLVHGEFERNDMVEYFGEHLAGFLFTKFGWVQSYGTRCVKPPIIWGDVKR
jgi:5-methyltetrahydropteroyltriglutamate--homocysteine methyltransferase